MPKVQFNKVTLSGFGPYRETVEFTFNNKMNVLVAPNETGKSTLVAGIGAIIFGIPQTTDESVFGQSRFRNWDHPLRFEGEIICTINEKSYRIRRDFNNNQVSLARREGEQYREIASGTHNPRAQKRNIRYEEKIKTLFGLSSRELFEATFCLTQPLPEGEEIDGRVQELLSGTGTGFNQAIEKITEELRLITRFTGRRGVTSRDAVDARELELLEEEILQIKQEIEKDREIVDRLEEYRKSLSEQEILREKKEGKLREKERTLKIWSEWVHFNESYNSARKLYNQINHAKEQANKLSAELKEVKEQKTDFPWGPSLPAETGEIISELQALQERKINLEEQILKLEESLVKSVEVNGNRDEDGASSRIDWSVFGSGPVSLLKGFQRQVAEALSDWENIEQVQAAHRECQEMLEEEFALFKGANPDLIETLKSYRDRKARLHSDLESSILRLEKARAELKRNKRQSKFRALLALIFAVGTSVAANLFSMEGVWGFVILVLSFFAGAGLGYLLGKVIYPIASQTEVDQRVIKNELMTKQAQLALEDFNNLVRPFELQFNDLATASRRWEQFQFEQEETALKLQEFKRRELGGFAGEAGDFPLDEERYKVTERWLELREFARAVEPGKKFGYLRDLLNWLEARTPQWWERLLAEAEDYEEKIRVCTEVKARNKANQEHLERQHQELKKLADKEELLAKKISSLLDYAGGNYNEAKKYWLSWQKLELKAEKALDSLKNILVTQRVDSLEGLEDKNNDALIKSQAIYSEWQKLKKENPELIGIEQVDNPEKIAQDYRRLEQETEELKTVLSRIDQRIRELNTDIARVQGQEPVNIAMAELRLKELEERRDELKIMVDALTLAYEELTAAINDFQSSYRTRLSEISSEYYQSLTGLSNRMIEISEDFKVNINIDGRLVVPSQLSHGARDQLYIALRLGIAQLLAEDTVLPFIFDDPFLNCDDERLNNIKSSLEILAKERQILLLSHRNDFALWGKTINVS